MKTVKNDGNRTAAADEPRRSAGKEPEKTALETNLAGTGQEALRLINELQSLRIELEKQNHQLRQAQDELELSRNSYVELYDYAPVSYFIFDEQGLVLEANLAGALLLAAEKQLLIGKPFGSFIADAAGREIFSNHLALVLQRKVMLRCEISLMSNAGVVFRVQLQSIAKEKIGDTSGYISTTIIDVTERRRAEEALRQSEERLRFFIAYAPAALAMFDRTMCYMYASNRWLSDYGIEDRNLYGVSHYEVFPEISDEWKEFHRRGLAGEVVRKEEDCFVRADGSKQWLCWEIRPWYGQDGTIEGIVIFTEEITKRKLAEMALQKSHEDLEQTVIERTNELKRKNLQLTQEIDERKKAEESLQSAYSEIRVLQDRLVAENIYLQQEIDQKHNFGEIIGQGSALTQVLSRVEQVAPMNATVLLLGETGTGKGMIARAIHSRSVRKDRPMITVNCTSLPANLIESELFGRERGAFTGADSRQIGRFELASGGTIFLDEIGEMPMELQSKLLRVIQDGEFERLGSPRTIKVDVRIIAASHRNLEEEVRNGRFREDLYYRLNVFPITIPALRQRTEDIPLLVNHFIDKFNRKTGKKIETVSRETLQILQEYHWPGNVRELENVIERSIITSLGTTLQILDRFDTFRKPEADAEADFKALADLEQNHILQVLQKTGWRIEGNKGAAVLLGLNPSTLRARMRKYGIRRQ